MRNPTDGKVRHDQAGSGSWGSPRGNRRHKGVDFACEPGQPVYSPITGKVKRVAYPYSDTQEYAGVVVENSRIIIKMFYLHPYKNVIGKNVVAGQKIGTAQDITKRYDGQGMTPHIHLQIDSIDPMLLIDIP